MGRALWHKHPGVSSNPAYSRVCMICFPMWSPVYHVSICLVPKLNNSTPLYRASIKNVRWAQTYISGYTSTIHLYIYTAVAPDLLTLTRLLDRVFSSVCRLYIMPCLDGTIYALIFIRPTFRQFVSEYSHTFVMYILKC